MYPHHAAPTAASSDLRSSRWTSALLAGAVAAAVVLPMGVGGTLLLTSRSSAPSTSTSALASAPVGSIPGTTGSVPANPTTSVAGGDTVGPEAVPTLPVVPVIPGNPTPAPDSPATPPPPPVTTPPAPTGPAPTFTAFFTPDTIDCHNGNQQNFTMSWSTADAVKVSVAADGATMGTYGPSAEISVPFHCSSPHSYTLTATGPGGKTATKSITLQPRNVQPPEAPDSDDES